MHNQNHLKAVFAAINKMFVAGANKVKIMAIPPTSGISNETLAGKVAHIFPDKFPFSCRIINYCVVSKRNSAKFLNSKWL